MTIEMEFVTEEMEESREGSWVEDERSRSRWSSGGSVSVVSFVVVVGIRSVGSVVFSGLLLSDGGSVGGGDALKSCVMNETSFSVISCEASSRAKRLEAGAGSMRPDAGVGVAIEMIPLIRSDTALCISLECSGESMSISLWTKSCEDSHYKKRKKEKASG